MNQMCGSVGRRRAVVDDAEPEPLVVADVAFLRRLEERVDAGAGRRFEPVKEQGAPDACPLPRRVDTEGIEVPDIAGHPFLDPGPQHLVLRSPVVGEGCELASHRGVALEHVVGCPRRDPHREPVGVASLPDHALIGDADVDRREHLPDAIREVRRVRKGPADHRVVEEGAGERIGERLDATSPCRADADVGHATSAIHLVGCSPARPRSVYRNVPFAMRRPMNVSTWATPGTSDLLLHQAQEVVGVLRHDLDEHVVVAGALDHVDGLRDRAQRVDRLPDVAGRRVVTPR